MMHLSSVLGNLLCLIVTMCTVCAKMTRCIRCRQGIDNHIAMYFNRGFLLLIFLVCEVSDSIAPHAFVLLF